jgi:hypothetical protein
MKFTLSLHDYMNQYMTNMEQQSMCCPVCYECVMCDDSHKDMLHMIECYKDEIITRVLIEYHDTHGELPVLSDEFMDMMESRVMDEMNRYYSNFK